MGEKRDSQPNRENKKIGRRSAIASHQVAELYFSTTTPISPFAIGSHEVAEHLFLEISYTTATQTESDTTKPFAAISMIPKANN